MLLEREACDDVYLSAFREGRMSGSCPHKGVIATVLAVASLLLAGCGDNAPESPVARPSAATGASVQTGATVEAEPTAHAGGATGATATEGDNVPVEIRLKNGGFAESTPRRIHVPADFLISVFVTSGKGGPFNLSVQSPSTAQTFKIASNDSLNITLDSLKAGEVAKLMIGGETVRITPDADPGP
jgi:hypothetical protein